MPKLCWKVLPGVLVIIMELKRMYGSIPVSQSPTQTTAGSGVKGFDGFMEYAEKMSPLGNASADDCANYLRDYVQ